MATQSQAFSLKKVLKDNQGLILFMLLMCCFRSAVADWYTVPTGSMLPTIQLGDRITVDKMAYDLRVPFSDIALMTIAEPQRGDIVVFESKAADKRLIKRVIGLPGDRVAMHQDRVFINGELLSYQRVNHNEDQLLASEQLGDITHSVRIETHAPANLSNFTEVTVPQDHYLVLGDNRRNSADSRVYGFVPRSELKGKAHHVVFSLDYDNHFIPRSNRSFVSLY